MGNLPDIFKNFPGLINKIQGLQKNRDNPENIIEISVEHQFKVDFFYYWSLLNKIAKD